MKEQKLITRTLHPEVRVSDAKAGLVEYIASDETLDSYREVIRASGWRFSLFSKNAPFVDSHDYSSIRTLLGEVVDFAVRGRKLINVVRWAKDVPENSLAQLGWKMTQAGYLKAVSVGFYPVRALGGHSQGADRIEFQQQLEELDLDEQSAPRTIYVEQEQIELSAVVLGANPNALAKAYKAEVLTDEDLNTLSARVAENQQQQRSQLATPSTSAGDDGEATRRRHRALFLGYVHQQIKTL